MIGPAECSATVVNQRDILQRAQKKQCIPNRYFDFIGSMMWRPDPRVMLLFPSMCSHILVVSG
jgi:hypothetical protein